MKLAIEEAGDNIEKLIELGRSYENVDQDISIGAFKKVYGLDKQNVEAFKKVIEYKIYYHEGNDVLSEIEEQFKSNFEFFSYTGFSKEEFLI